MKVVTSRPSLKKKNLPHSKNGAHSAHDLIKRVQNGLRFKELETLGADLGLPMEKLGPRLGIARATLYRRKVAGRLGPDESDRVLRFAQLFRMAVHVFGGKNEARLWLSFPQYGLGGVVPLDYARTEVGAREVENLLGRIEYGVLA